MDDQPEMKLAQCHPYLRGSVNKPGKFWERNIFLQVRVTLTTFQLISNFMDITRNTLAPLTTFWSMWDILTLELH